MKRIDTLRALKRERARLQREFDAALIRHKLTHKELERLGGLDDRLNSSDGLNEKIDRFHKNIEAWGDEWAQDDWPHAHRRGQPRTGCLTIYHLQAGETT